MDWKNAISKFLVNHGEKIFTGLAIATGIAATVTAVAATPKAIEVIREKEEEKGEELTPVEVVKECWPLYTSSALLTVASVGSMVYLNQVHGKIYNGLAAAYTVTDAAYSEYRNKVLKKFGPKKEKEVRDEIAQARVVAIPRSSFIPGTGQTLCYDGDFGRYFYSDIDKISKAENEVNREILSGLGTYATLNDFYTALKIPTTNGGSNLVWDVDRPLEIIKSSTLAEDGTPCLVIGYYYLPEPLKRSF